VECIHAASLEVRDDIFEVVELNNRQSETAAEEREEKVRGELAAAGDPTALHRLLDGYAERDRLAAQLADLADGLGTAQAEHAKAVAALAAATTNAEAAAAAVRQAEHDAEAARTRDRAATLAKMAEEAEYFYGVTTGVREVQEKFAARVDDAVRPALGDLCTTFQTIDWTREAIGAAIKSVAAKHQLKPPQVMMAVRALVTGTPQTPAIDAVLALVGRERTVERLGRGLAT